ncbi:MAG: hypothetical protein M3132_11005 [Actinomycetia bacterium]|nr:hypothetical protein [Actinomycetes bacterium]
MDQFVEAATGQLSALAEKKPVNFRAANESIETGPWIADAKNFGALSL